MNWLSNLKLRAQMMVMVATIAALATLGGVYNAVTSIGFTSSADRVFSVGSRSQELLGDLAASYQQMRGDFMLMIITRSQDDITRYSGSASSAAQQMDSSLQALTGLVGSEHQALLARLKEKAAQFRTYRERLELLTLLGQSAEARTILFDEIEGLRVAMQEDISRLTADIRHAAAVDIAASQASARVVVFSSIAVPLLVLVITFALGGFISSSITKPLHLLQESIGTADLNTAFRSQRRDEVGDLMRAFDQFVATIKTTLLSVVETSATVASATAQISSSTEEMAAGAQQQTAQADEVARGVEQLTRTIAENAKEASVASDTARTARSTAESGGAIVMRSIDGMKRIATKVRTAGETVKILGASSDQIGDIVAVIDDIADQTNLLALNAAIEAARAGEQGRGFAVVADEVRRLAERTSVATKEIGQTISKIQSDTRDAVQSMEDGQAEVEQGIQLADAAGNALREIVEISKSVTDKVTTIAAASEEQAATSEEIARTVDAISGVTRETSVGIQQIARTAEEVSRLTVSLDELVRRFQIHGADGHTTASARAAGESKESAAARLAVTRNGRIVSHT